MKIVITALEGAKGLAGEVDPRFGRAAAYLLVDPVTGEWEEVPKAIDHGAASGAGIQAAQLVTDAGAGWVLTGSVGPKAFRALHAAGIQVGIGQEGTVQETLDRYRQGRVVAAAGANVEGHR